MKRIAVVCAFVLTGFAGTVRAATLTQTVDISSQSLDFNSSASFNKFDAALGTLLNIEFVVSGTAGDQVTVTNTAGRPRTFDLSLLVNLSLQGSGFVFDEAIPTASQNLTLGPNQTQTVSGSASGDATTIYSGTTGALVSYTGTTATGSVNPSILPSDFIGAGQKIDITFDAANYSSVSGGSNNSSSSGSAGGSVQLIYSYSPFFDTTSIVTAVPEPTAGALFASAFLGLGLLGRRKKTTGRL